MAHKLGLEARVTIKELKRRGYSNRSIARTLGVTEGAIRYHHWRQTEGVVDGRSCQQQLAAGWRGEIEAWLEAVGSEVLNLADLHRWLVTECAYPGSQRSVQRYYRKHYPAPKKRARRRVETPPGAQAQADWAEFRNVLVAGRRRHLYAFHLELSYSRYAAVVWSERKDQLSWLKVHSEALQRLGGVPATIRVDNEKTAVVRGAGAWGQINEAYRRYAYAVRFHIDACPPRSPRYKGKVERLIRQHRLAANPSYRHWTTLGELQQWSDQRVYQSACRRQCPMTGSNVEQAWHTEKPQLGQLPDLPEAFDVVCQRTVSDDCLVTFERRRYSVPFALLGQRVEVRGCAATVQIIVEGQIVAQHRRHSLRRLLIEQAHYDGSSTETVVPPPPLGRMGSRLEEIARLVPEKRPLDLYEALAEVAR